MARRNLWLQNCQILLWFWIATPVHAWEDGMSRLKKSYGQNLLWLSVNQKLIFLKVSKLYSLSKCKFSVLFSLASTPSSVPETRASQKVQRKRTLNVSDPSSNKIVASNKNIKVVSSKSIKNSVASGRQNVIPSSRPYIRGVSGELCPEKGCNCRLFTVFEYYSHIAEKHGLKKLKCPLTHCDVYFAEFNVEQMRKHASEWHSELTESERKCGQCEYVALSIPLKVYHHFEFHMPNGQWWCRTGCGFASKVRNDWISHEKSEKCPRFRYKE